MDHHASCMITDYQQPWGLPSCPGERETPICASEQSLESKEWEAVRIIWAVSNWQCHEREMLMFWQGKKSMPFLFISSSIHEKEEGEGGPGLPVGRPISADIGRYRPISARSADIGRDIG